jgi:hypothetical protein
MQSDTLGTHDPTSPREKRKRRRETVTGDKRKERERERGEDVRRCADVRM